MKSVWLTLTQTSQENVMHWHHLLRARGGRLNPQKCNMFSFQWSYNEEGMATLKVPQAQPTQQLSIPDKNGQPYTLHQNNSDKAVWFLLGVQTAMDGNYEVELGINAQQKQKYVQAHQQCNLSHWEESIVL